jgi:signal transduction histidine kinase
MKDVRVRPLLFCSIFVMAALPLLAAFYLLNRTLETSLDLGFNPRILRILDHGAQNLKSLRRLDPDRQELYRGQFAELQELRHVYASPELLKSNVLRSLRVYFGAGLIIVVVLSVLVAVLLSRRISLAYSANFVELMRHRAQMRYLQEISSWQEMAKMLAHEIKNPLTPIEILLSSPLQAAAGIRDAAATNRNDDCRGAWTFEEHRKSFQ